MNKLERLVDFVDPDDYYADLELKLNVEENETKTVRLNINGRVFDIHCYHRMDVNNTIRVVEYQEHFMHRLAVWPDGTWCDADDEIVFEEMLQTFSDDYVILTMTNAEYKHWCGFNK